MTEGKALGSGECKELGSGHLCVSTGKKLIWGFATYNRHFDINVGRAARQTFLLTLGGLYKAEMLQLMLGGLHVKHVLQRGIWVPTQHLS